ncbi:MAG TPA: hypothetical protein VHW69_14885, partial [Rhizomicrobium sp.]|nr:hypothetical protein [Rhizomicrobium sp.]
WYDALGNITRKNDVSVIGGYHYGEGGAGPHQLTSIQSCGGACQSDVIPNGHYVYDANGNLSCVTAAAPCDRTAARVFAYSSFNMVTSIGLAAARRSTRSPTIPIMHAPRRRAATVRCSTSTIRRGM